MAKKTEIENEKVCAILSYLLVGIIWYLADEKMKKSQLAKFHAKQGLVLLIVSVAGHIILTLIPIIGWVILPFFSLVILIFAILGIINAANSTHKELPIIGQFGDKFNI